MFYWFNSYTFTSRKEAYLINLYQFLKVNFLIVSYQISLVFHLEGLNVNFYLRAILFMLL